MRYIYIDSFIDKRVRLPVVPSSTLVSIMSTAPSLHKSPSLGAVVRVTSISWLTIRNWARCSHRHNFANNHSTCEIYCKLETIYLGFAVVPSKTLPMVEAKSASLCAEWGSRTSHTD